MRSESSGMDYKLHEFMHMHTRQFSLSKQKGFTLLELLIVMGVIAILVVIALPQMSMYKARGSNAAAQSDLKNFKVAMEAYYAEHAAYPILLY
jgi:prepilin-type N-terminal cleavage/methylation domain-containing protein